MLHVRTVKREFLPFRRLVDLGRETPVTASDITNVGGLRAKRPSAIAALLPMIADGNFDAIPVLERGGIVGIFSQGADRCTRGSSASAAAKSYKENAISHAAAPSL